MCDADALLKEVIAQAKALGIPVSSNILPNVQINTRAKTRLGRCAVSADGSCRIELAERVIAAQAYACKTVLAHEILHSCEGCRNHQAQWKRYAQRMNAAYGYDIQRTHSPETLGVSIEEAYGRYRLQCHSCGAMLTRMKKSPLVLHPEHYRCRCGGRLMLL
ncbi:MAG: SprT-like domain-containing protein [Candidatus Fimivivens sp.]